ncbi:MAG: hypothetical protein WBH76_04790 [Dictyoglomaceae bacterium]
MKLLKGKSIEEISREHFRHIIKDYTHIVMDIGTGEGEFIYGQARRNPETLYIGLDSCADRMVRVSLKAGKKTTKGGLKNVLFVVDDAMAISDDLAFTADNIFIHFPWGSLRDGIIKGDARLLQNLVKVSKADASLEIYITYCRKYEENEMISRNLPELSMHYLREVLKERFHCAGIQVTEISAMDNEALKSLQTKWAKKLAYGKAREIFHIRCRILKKK